MLRILFAIAFVWVLHSTASATCNRRNVTCYTPICSLPGKEDPACRARQEQARQACERDRQDAADEYRQCVEDERAAEQARRERERAQRDQERERDNERPDYDGAFPAEGDL